MLTVAAYTSTTRGGTPTGTAWIRLLAPLGHPSLAGRLHFQDATGWAPGALDADVVVVQRDAIREAATLVSLVETVRRRDARLVCELDDDLLTDTGHRDRNPRQDAEEAPFLVRYLLAHADAVLTPSSVLAARLEAFNGTVHCLPNALDERLWGLESAHEPASTVPDGVVRIGYVGTRTHGHDLAMIAPAVERVVARAGGRIEFDVAGGAAGTPSFGNPIELPAHNPYPGYCHWLATLARRRGWSIALAPLVDDAFNGAKSFVKYLEYAALGLAPVVSNVPAYRGVVEDGVDGLLATSGTDAWVACIESLAASPERRRAVAAAARTKVSSAHTLSRRAADWVRVLETVRAAPGGANARAPASPDDARGDALIARQSKMRQRRQTGAPSRGGFGALFAGLRRKPRP